MKSVDANIILFKVIVCVLENLVNGVQQSFVEIPKVGVKRVGKT